MVVVFGGFLAAGFPVLGAVASISGALASLLGFSYLLDLDATAVNVVTVLALGLCIDYGLLVVSRFREEMRARLAGRPAAEATPRGDRRRHRAHARTGRPHRRLLGAHGGHLAGRAALPRHRLRPGRLAGRGVGGRRRPRRRALPRARALRARRAPAAAARHRGRRRHRRLLPARRDRAPRPVARHRRRGHACSCSSRLRCPGCSSPPRAPSCCRRARPSGRSSRTSPPATRASPAPRCSSWPGPPRPRCGPGPPIAADRPAWSSGRPRPGAGGRRRHRAVPHRRHRHGRGVPSARRLAARRPAPLRLLGRRAGLGHPRLPAAVARSARRGRSGRSSSPRSCCSSS